MAFMTQPPDPNPKTPKLRCPPGAVDCHIHFFGPEATYPFDAKTPYHSGDALAEDYIALQNVLGLHYAVMVNAGGYGRNPQLLIDTLRRFPGRFRGVVVPKDDLSSPEIAEMDALGVCGVRFVSLKRGSHFPQVLPDLAARIAEFGWHVQFYPSGADITDYVDQLMALRNTIVLDHFGSVPTAGGIDQPAFKTILRMLESGRVWVKMSGPMRCMKEDFPYAAMTPFARALVKHAPERLVWASDWPHANMTSDRAMPNDGDLLDLMLEWVPDEAVRNRILARNAWDLYGFEPVA
ncbi:amidohydrolase family protein [Humitalea sp. 24SJ18S-53]|uniref:amidohydrolase family protein n=1 Tax=Humitalea sp. 24SJ18S-53 TaxID=3422307 RepID=UPI003D669D9B